ISVANMSGIIFDYVLRGVTGRTAFDEWQAARTDIMDECFPELTRNNMQDRLIYAAHRDRHSLTDNPNTESARKAIAQARAAGIPVAMLRFPSNAPAYEKFNVPQHLIDYYGLGYVPTPEQLLPGTTETVKWMEYPRPAPDHFCDFVHFNQTGRAAFSPWLLQQIADALPR
ncbi:MAG: hypothetical protein KJ667_02785, partial [Alphaproteobacteria bacterium]|nr:hypothetical protein [Alphaproteobacteria bacterium]